MKYFNLILIVLGGLLTAFIFFNFVVILPVYLQQLGKPITQTDITNFYLIKSLVTFIGFVIGIFVFRKIIAD